MAERKIVTVLKPEDEYPHEPDPAPSYNESMYLNAFDLTKELGAWFRLGNRANEGYAEMTVCVYLPDERIGFMYGRPSIESNAEMRAGGLEISVVEPFEHLQIAYQGTVCLLDDPRQMADPRAAFKANPFVDCSVRLDVHGVSPMYGGLPQYEDGSALDHDPSKGFAKAHYEQHTSVSGTVSVGDAHIELDGFGLRDKSWGPRSWQAVSWYRWLPMIFGPDFAMMLQVSNNGVKTTRKGVVLEGDEYHRIRECTIESTWDDDLYQTAMTCWARTDHREYEVVGEVLSLIPLRNRRTTPEGEQLHTRITEAMTRFECDGRVGMGMSEYLDQLVDGLPVGPDVSR